jgi:NADH:ubiquinone oxidoreductase subunit C
VSEIDLQADFDLGILDAGDAFGDEWIAVAPESIRSVLTDLHAIGYELSFLTAVDHLGTSTGNSIYAPEGARGTPGGLDQEPRFELLYQLRSMGRGRTLRVRTFVGGDDPHLATVHDIYPNANWDERETWDLFGIRFDGHPALTRILMPDDWVGHPLRRDFPVGGEPVDFTDDHAGWDTAPPEA